MDENIIWVGIDAHKKTLQVAVFNGREFVGEWEIANEIKAIQRLARKLQKLAGGGELRCCYEAGPCGYVLKRQLEAAASTLICEVVAPSLIPVKAGDRVKTDRRDARKLAQYLASGLLTEVHPPSEQDEAVRDLTRCRLAMKGDLMRARHRLSKLLLRRGIQYSAGKKAWTDAYHKWLGTVRFDNPIDQMVFDQYRLVVEQSMERVAHITTELERVSQSEPYAGPVGWLRCFRGIDTVSAITLIAEVHDFRRFESPLQLMAYFGLTPSEHSSGDSQKRGPITKTGNSHARRILVEASWHYRHRASVGKRLAERRQGQPVWAIAVADKSQVRLCRRYQRLTASGKAPQKAAVAVARELVGFIWAAMREGQTHQTST